MYSIKYSDSLLARTLNSRGNQFANISENQVLANISGSTVPKMWNAIDAMSKISAPHQVGRSMFFFIFLMTWILKEMTGKVEAKFHNFTKKQIVVK